MAATYANENPTQVGGPGQSAAVVAYPVPTSQNYNYRYNYKDTVIAEWFSWAENSSATTMQIWYWSPTFSNKQYQPMTKYVVPQNGTLAFDLSDGITDKLKAGGYYLGQWNLNFTRTDMSPVTGLTLSQPFNCTFDDSKAATTYSDTSLQSSTAAPSSTSTSGSSAASTTSTASSTPTSAAASSAPTAGILGANAPASSTSATPVSNGISGGAIAGIVIAILLAVALGAAGAFFFLRRKRRQEAAAAQAGGFPPGPAPYPGADAYKQQPMMGTPMGAPMGGVHYSPSQKSGYNAHAQEMNVPPAYAQQQQQYGQQGAYVSELPGGGYQQGGVQAPHSQYSTATTIRQELPAERYS